MLINPKISLYLLIMLTLLLAGCDKNGSSSQPETTRNPNNIQPKKTLSPTPPATSTPTPISPSATPTKVEEGWCTSSEKLSDETLVIGYFPDYQNLNIAWGNCLTDLIYFSIEPTTSGELDLSRVDFSVLEDLKTLKENYGTRLHLSLGGYKRSDNFGVVVLNPKIKKKFTENVVSFAKEHNFDGVDFDWEFPKTEAEFNGYLDLIASVKEQGMIVSVALYPIESFDIRSYSIVDRVHIMSYERGARHSTYTQAVADLRFFMERGFPKKKLILGIPFYGRQMSHPYEYFSYAQIVEKYYPIPETNEVDDIYFNGIDLVQKKTCYVKKHQFGGVMIWELGQDSGGNHSLLRAIHEAATSECNQ